VFEYLAHNAQDIGPPVGLNVVVDGTVPIGAGLSSSAAIVCSSAIGILAALNITSSKQDVSEFSCTCERHIGTQSGGMDQVSFLHLIVFLQSSHSFEIFVSCGSYFLVVLSILASNCKGFQLKLVLKNI
jgi:mevalonate kinase